MPLNRESHTPQEQGHGDGESSLTTHGKVYGAGRVYCEDHQVLTLVPNAIIGTADQTREDVEWWRVACELYREFRRRNPDLEVRAVVLAGGQE